MLSTGRLKWSPGSRDIPPILLSGMAKPITRAEHPTSAALRAQARDHPARPVEPDQLPRIVAACLR